MAKARKSLDATPETDWRTETDLNTLVEAEKIEKDPKRMAAVSKLAKSRLLGLASIAAEGGEKP